MSYNNGSPNGELYIGNVKWSNDYQSTMLFNNTSARDSFMQSQLSKIKSNVIYYNKNGYIDVDSNIKGMSGYNYVYFKCDSDISNYWYCCFITDYDYIAPKTTRIYVEIDVIQTYLYATTIYNSMIDRAHILKSQDQLNRWLAPEPVGAPPVEYRTLGQDTFDWTPKWVLHSTSITNADRSDFVYGGRASGDYISGEFATVATSADNLRDLVKGYTKSISTAVDVDWSAILNSIVSGGMAPSSVGAINVNADRFYDHSNEIIGVFARPQWSLGAGIHQVPQIIAPYCDIDLNKSTLACSRNGQYYKPRNNKMLSSLCNAYQLHNQSGVNINLRPEYCTDTKLRLQVQSNAMDTAGYKLIIGRYSDLSVADINCPYSASTSVVLDTNTGLNKAVNVLSTVIGTATNIGGSVAGFGLASNVVGSAVSGVSDLFSALNTQPISAGNTSQLLSVNPAFQKLILRQVSPSYEECVAIDDFLDVYGYAIGEVLNVRSYMSTRSNWNYIKTNGINLSCPAPTNYSNQLKAIFNNGITFWHNYSTFGDYSQANN